MTWYAVYVEGQPWRAFPRRREAEVYISALSPKRQELAVIHELDLVAREEHAS